VLIDVIILIEVVVMATEGLELETTTLELVFGLTTGMLVLLEATVVRGCTAVEVIVLIEVTTLIKVLVKTELDDVTGGTTTGGTTVELESVVVALGGIRAGLCGVLELNGLAGLKELCELD
jgi:hypothetical protein